MDRETPDIPPPKLINALRGFDLLPAIIFLPTRRKCDESALDVAGDKSQKHDKEKQQKREEIFAEFAAENPEIKNHKHRKILVDAGVASHHAGHIPAWKLVIEKMMSAGLLNAIFATSTVAAGVDFPARTVVISNADTRGNEGWRPLRASELQQMTGRAGRRGKDNVGFAVLAPGQFQNPKKIAELLKAPPDPLHSQFRATYTSLLNLLDAFGEFTYLRDIAEKSFAFRKTRQQIEMLRKQADEHLDKIGAKLSVDGHGVKIENVFGFERLTSALMRLQEKLPVTRAELRHNWLRENVVEGRIITQGRSGKRLFIVLNVHGDAVSAMRDDGQGTTLPLDRVNRVYGKIYTIRHDTIEKAFFDVFEGKNRPLDEPKVSFKKGGDDDATVVINGLIDKLLPDDLSGDARHQATQLLWEERENAENITRIRRDIAFLKDEIWLPFERRAKVLDHFGYLDFYGEKVTERGKWLADLRIDRPLLAGEALRRGIFDELEPKYAAGIMAALAADPERNYGELYLSDRLIDLLSQFESVIYDISKVEWRFGVERAEEINYSAAAAAERWAGGMDWPTLVARTKAEEGDLVRLLSRTGEALLQVAHLGDTTPKAAEIARLTAQVILREPVR
ncbi:MAG TPA: hypothetical protein VL325_07930 [Pyrinomonadaceae bacterium]|nr:hypothetical protein [Pyrinomonadaceae bacterium]